MLSFSYPLTLADWANEQEAHKLKQPTHHYIPFYISLWAYDILLHI